MTLREKALALPLKPGVYIMKDADGNVIYVGKAKQLKNRVSSYFHGAHNLKTETMISKIADFSVIIADSEFEALLLENSLIKHHTPKYNILLKDDKGYPFVKLDKKSEYPRFTVVSRREDDGAEYFGPFGGRGTTFSALDAILKTLGLPTCSKKFPRDIGKERPCLNHHLGVCDAYCRPEASAEDYRRAIEKAAMILRGKGKELADDLRREMEDAAMNLRFEEAAEKRDMINAITALEKKQHVLLKGSRDTDAVGFYRGQLKSCFNVLHYVGGQLLGKDFELLDDPADEDAGEVISTLVRQYYAAQGASPRTVLLPVDTGDVDELSRFLTELSGYTVTVTVPQRGVKRDFIQSAEVNAKEETERHTTREERVTKTAAWLQEALGLSKPPVRIESYDISNTGSSDIVASMVVYDHGRPLKRDYRKFKMKTVSGQDDYGSMREVISRRFKRYNEGDDKFSTLPDLLLIDGGDVHASAAREAAAGEGISLPVFGMVKDDRHRTRALITPDGLEIGIDAFPAAFSFIGGIQEETHRFAIEFHRSSHLKSVKKSPLDDIPGVGEKRKQDLYKHFKSLKAITSASEAELAAVVPKNAARAIYEHFHTESGV